MGGGWDLPEPRLRGMLGDTEGSWYLGGGFGGLGYSGVQSGQADKCSGLSGWILVMCTPPRLWDWFCPQALAVAIMGQGAQDSPSLPYGSVPSILLTPSQLRVLNLGQASAFLPCPPLLLCPPLFSPSSPRATLK